MDAIIAALTGNPVLFGLALLVNILVGVFKDVTEGISKGKGLCPDQGIPAVLFRNLLIIMVLGLSYTGTFWLCKLGYIMAIEGSTFTTAIVVAVMSMFFYTIGVKDVIEWAKGKFIKKDGA